MVCSFAEPIQNGFLFYPFYSMDGCQTVPFGKHSQAFQDFFWAMMQAVKYGPFIPYEYSATDFAFQTLRALVSATIPDYVSVIYFAIARTVSIPTKRTC